MYEYGCEVDRVVDGDTIDVTLDLGFDILFKSRVRLYGIDTPESRTRNLDEKARGKLATKFLQDDINTCLLYTYPSPRDQRGERMAWSG